MFTLDPEIAAMFAAMGMDAATIERPKPGDVLGLRRATDAAIGPGLTRLAPTPEVIETRLTTPGDDGTAVPLLWYEKLGSRPGSAIVYVHGGGMVAGTAPLYGPMTRFYAAATGVPILSVDYRLAPEHSENGLARDVMAGLRCLLDQAETLGIDPARIAIMGDSGGGGVAASAAIMARDAGIALARQILIYPMLDDRNVVPDPLIAPHALWTYESNRTAWDAVRGDAAGTAEVSPYLAPARLTDFAGLAPAYIEVGELDIFRDESIAYAQKLYAAGVSCELHVHPGAPHGHDWANLEAGISRRVLAERLRLIQAI